MATRTTSTRNLVGMQSIAFIRAIDIRMTLSASRPNTQMNVFFDGINVNQYCKTLNGALGENLVSDALGGLNLIFSIPPSTFSTGTKTIIITDAPSLDEVDINGSVFGSATANFTSTGVTEFYQTTTTVTEIVEVVQPPPPRNTDPLAQSFFTYGVKGGCFVTSIDLYFNTKDSAVPVQVDIRELVNGYPDSEVRRDPQKTCVVDANYVNVSKDGSIPTKFKFTKPVYLKEDSDYCFVVFSNSKNYNVFTSRLGERSFETKRVIFEQPYSGSLFKSENNITWQPEQFEDLKFKLNIAKFDTSATAIVKMKSVADFMAIDGNYFSTISGSSSVRVKQTVQHGLEINSKIYIAGDTNAIYNGISNANISGQRNVTAIIDAFTYEFAAGAAATVTGIIETGGQVRSIYVDSSGSGYTSTPTVTITGGGGTGATATARVSGGKVVAVDVTAPGSGYTSTPTVTITGGGGSGVSVIPVIEAKFSVSVNKPTAFVSSKIPYAKFADTEISSKITTTQLNYTGGNLNTYSPSETVDFSLNGRTYLSNYSLIASIHNEKDRMGGNPSTLLEYNLKTSNPNVSPVIDLSNAPALISYNYKLNNQTGEDFNATTSTGLISQVVLLNSGSGYNVAPTISFVDGGGSGGTAVALLGSTTVSTINVTNGGSGYTSPPVVTLTGGGGTGAVATAVLAGTSIASIVVTNGGSGYTSVPSIVFSGGGGGTGAAATAVLSAVGVASATIDSAGSGYTSVPTVAFSGGGGTGAAGTAVLTTGSVASIAVTSGGSGYTSAPTVAFSGGGGTGAAATATLTTAGVASIAVTAGGSGYTTATVSITGDGTGATATATISGGAITAITVTAAGSGYTTAPSVSITGDGTGATATATLSTRSVASITVTNSGSGYTSAPTISFSGGAGTGAAATATLTARSVASITITNAGTGYTSAPTIAITGGGGTGALATAVLATRSVASITIDNAGTGYTVAPSLIFSGGGGTGAAATATLSTRSVASVTLTNGGSGYTSAPTVSFSGGAGTGAAATAVISGRTISSIVITNPGSNYSSAPEVVVTRTDGSTGVDAIATAVLTTFNSELSATSGTALSRYVTKKFSLETPSTGINLFSEIYSENASSVDWYIRTSKSGSGIAHDSLEWKILKCDKQRNLSTKRGEVFDYQFYLYGLTEFDTYDLKCVLRSSNPVKAPEVNNYRVIIVA